MLCFWTIMMKTNPKQTVSLIWFEYQSLTSRFAQSVWSRLHVSQACRLPSLHKENQSFSLSRIRFLWCKRLLPNNKIMLRSVSKSTELQIKRLQKLDILSFYAIYIIMKYLINHYINGPVFWAHIYHALLLHFILQSSFIWRFVHFQVFFHLTSNFK